LDIKIRQRNMALLQFTYWAALCSSSYLSQYARELGMSGVAVGTMAALIAAMGMVAPPIFGIVADKIGSVIESDELAGKLLNQIGFGLFIGRIDDHAVGYAAVEFLHMAGAYPDSYLVGGMKPLGSYLGQTASGAYLNALHAENELLILNAQFIELLYQILQILGAYGNDNGFTVQNSSYFCAELHGIGKLKIVISALGDKSLHICAAGSAVEGYIMADMVKIPCDK